MYRSDICDTKPAISLKRSDLEPKLLQSVYRNSCMAYRLVTNLKGCLAWPLSDVVKVMFDILVSELITQEQIAV